MTTLSLVGHIERELREYLDGKFMGADFSTFEEEGIEGAGLVGRLFAGARPIEITITINDVSDRI